MAFLGLSLPKRNRVTDFLGRVQRNAFDAISPDTKLDVQRRLAAGQPASYQAQQALRTQPVQTRAAIGAQPQRSFISKVYDQANPFDKGKTFVNAAPIQKPQIPQYLAAPKAPSNLDKIARGALAVGYGAARSGQGLVQGAGGLYDLLTPGLGQSRTTTFAKALGKQTDVQAQKLQLPIPYKAGQFLGEVAQLATGELVAKAATGAKPVISAFNKTEKLGEAIKGSNFAQKVTELSKLNKGTEAAAKLAQYVATPSRVLNVAANTLIDQGQLASTGKKITPTTLETSVALNYGLGGVGDLASKSLSMLKNKNLNQDGFIKLPGGKSEVITHEPIRNPDLAALVNSGKISNDVNLIKPGDIVYGGGVKAAPLNRNRVDYYKNLMVNEKKAIDPLIVSVRNGKIYLEDGKHRLQAMKELGITDVPAVLQRDILPKATTRPLSGAAQQSQLSKQAMAKPAVTQKLNPFKEELGAVGPGVGKLRAEMNAPAVSSKLIDKTPPSPGTLNITSKSGLKTQLMSAVVEKDQPLIKVLSQIEKKTGKKGIVDKFMYDSGLLSRSNATANQKLMSNKNLKNALSGMSKRDLADFNRYSAARSELYNASRGLTTSSPVASLQKTVLELRSKYATRFENMNKFYKDYSKDLLDNGIITKEKYAQFISSPDYVRIQRNMSDVVGFSNAKGGQGMSLRTTFTTKKRTGSQREILPVEQTAFQYAQKAQSEIQRNQAASGIIDALQGTDLIRPLGKGERPTNLNIIGRLKNGVQEDFVVSPEIKAIVSNLNPYQLGTLERLVSLPKRVVQATTTGLSVPFSMANYVKDQLGSAINSKNVIATHNPLRIFEGLYAASKDFAIGNNSASWQKFLAHNGDATQFDMLRNVANSKQLSRELRLGQVGKAINRISSPLKTLEDLISITEKATRYQNFRGMEAAAFKKTGNKSQALQEATLAAWQNSTDFSRFGTWGKTLNLLIPYFNSGIQGSRQIMRSLKQRPVATSVKLMAELGMPMVGLTAWNLSQPDRAAAYDNISDYEKENNLIIIPPGALSQNEDGTYNVWKIPMPQGYSNLIGPVRRSMESFSKQSPVDFTNIATDIIGAVSGPVSVGNTNQLVSGLIPAAVKPFVQQAANKNFFTGKPIVPDYIQQATTATGEPVPESQKAYAYTSATAKFLGNVSGKSPIRIEQFFKDTFGKVAQYGANASDNVAASLGLIKPDQIGGTSIKKDISRRFFEAQSNYNYMKPASGKYYDARTEALKGLNQNESKAYDAIHPSKTNFLGEQIFDENKRLTAYAKAGLYLQFPKVFEADRAINDTMASQGNPSNPLFDLTLEQRTRVLLKATLPPGAKDQELSNLYKQEWYQDYNTKRTKYFEQVKAKLTREGKVLPKSDNPYPTTPPNLQSAMDLYSSLPKGTGQRSSWIKSNPILWSQMTAQWSKVDAWDNKERQTLGLSPLEPFASTGKTGFGGAGGGGISAARFIKVPKAVKPAMPKARVKAAAVAKQQKPLVATRPKVTIKKSKV